jgi:hypothetical protein
MSDRVPYLKCRGYVRTAPTMWGILGSAENSDLPDDVRQAIAPHADAPSSVARRDRRADRCQGGKRPGARSQSGIESTWRTPRRRISGSTKPTARILRRALGEAYVDGRSCHHREKVRGDRPPLDRVPVADSRAMSTPAAPSSARSCCQPMTRRPRSLRCRCRSCSRPKTTTARSCIAGHRPLPIRAH